MQEKNKIQEKISLSQFSTFHIGGEAKFYIEVKNEEDLILGLNFAKKNGLKLYFLGGGSNILINSNGVDGLVLRFCNNNIDIYENGLICGAGATLLDTLSIATKNGFSGLEWSYGIPRATIGGSLIGNSGAFQVFMADIVKNVKIFDIKTNKFINFDNKSCNFSHKNSIFKENNNYIIWEIKLQLKKENPETIKETSKKYIETRLKTQSKYFNIGCIFKNISFEYIKKENPCLIDKFKINGDYLSSGLVIDSLGLKGKVVRGAKISEKHANFIVNTGKANSDDVLELINQIKQKVKAKYKIKLEEEIQFF